jgi:ATP-dependent Clp protease adaptor protein ClpS
MVMGVASWAERPDVTDPAPAGSKPAVLSPQPVPGARMVGVPSHGQDHQDHQDQRASSGGAPTLTPVEVDEPTGDTTVDPDRPWVVIVWNDPINLMSYVTYVLQKLFGYQREVAEKLMLQVHYEGRAVVSNGPREKAELDVFRLHEHQLWATMQQD